jgi:hypothetical protein
MRKLFYYAVSIALMALFVSNIEAQDSLARKKPGGAKGKPPREFKSAKGIHQGEGMMLPREFAFAKGIHPGEGMLPPGFDKGPAMQRSELRLSKRFEGESINSTKTFDVESAEMTISLSGSVESGKIIVKFSLPNGKEYKDFEIDPTSNVNWFVRVDTTSNIPFGGKWTIQVKTEKAVGYYNLRLSTR